jgi:hypothetical protein
MNAPPLNDLVLAAVALTEPDAGPERNAVIAGVLPEVALCTCVLCQQAERELNHMTWYYHTAGGHTHVRVFSNHAKCGDLCFRNEEFPQVKTALSGRVMFLEETYTEEAA